MPRGRKASFPANPYILLDPEDSHLLELSWKFTRTASNIYASRSLPGRKTELLHRRVMDCPPGMVVDHLNQDGLDCRRSNLRVCTQKQNLQRAHPTGGIRKKGSKWEASVGGRYLGMFDRAGLAIEACRLHREEVIRG